MTKLSISNLISPPEFENSRLVYQIEALNTDIKQLKVSVKHLEDIYHDAFNNESILEDNLSDLHKDYDLLEKKSIHQENQITDLVATHKKAIERIADQARQDNKRLQILLAILLMTIVTVLFLFPIIDTRELYISFILPKLMWLF